MYFDTLATATLNRYPQQIARVLEWLRAQDIDALPAGRHDIDGETIYAQVLDLTTQPADAIKPECHRRYLDVQYLHRGSETLGIAIDTGRNPIAEAYREDRDILFYATAENESFINVAAGQFSVLFPSDVHRPGIAAGQPQAIRKVVVKVLVDSL